MRKWHTGERGCQTCAHQARVYHQGKLKIICGGFGRFGSTTSLSKTKQSARRCPEWQPKAILMSLLTITPASPL